MVVSRCWFDDNLCFVTFFKRSQAIFSVHHVVGVKYHCLNKISTLYEMVGCRKVVVAVHLAVESPEVSLRRRKNDRANTIWLPLASDEEEARECASFHQALDLQVRKDLQELQREELGFPLFIIDNSKDDPESKKRVCLAIVNFIETHHHAGATARAGFEESPNHKNKFFMGDGKEERVAIQYHALESLLDNSTTRESLVKETTIIATAQVENV